MGKTRRNKKHDRAGKRQRLIDRTIDGLRAGEPVSETEIAAALAAARYHPPHEVSLDQLMRQAPRPEQP
jgi:hypothetical protein